jgi:hypothetical protein
VGFKPVAFFVLKTLFLIIFYNFDIMTTLSVNIDNKKSEKAVKAVLDALGLTYNVAPDTDTQRPLNKAEQRVYKNMKSALEQIKLHQEGKIKLRDARELLNEL